MNNNSIKKIIYDAAMAQIRLRYPTPETPTRNDIEKIVLEQANQINYSDQNGLNEIIKEILVDIDTRMGEGTSLIDSDTDHDSEWVYKQRNDIIWNYSKAYEKFLKQKKDWLSHIVESLNNAGARILGHLQDPKSPGRWDRRGLVIGHVQSGKTANYIEVITQAADAGYKFIIVIAGIHNNLRRQTQERIDEGFIGYSGLPRRPIGVGINIAGAPRQEYSNPVTLTNIYDDFNKKTARQSGWKLNDFTKPIILVIKKNVSTLKHLYDWLEQMNAQGKGEITDVPMLMIDDEADHASINTNKKDIDPTKTNAMIRKILKLFAKSCYVGYTATPFANIFINHEAYDDEVREELFPRHFIYCLDAPTNYLGPEQIFFNDIYDDETDEYQSSALESITDCENYLPHSHKKDYPLEKLPPSLHHAIDQFIIIKSIRILQGDSNEHCSMMVNISRFVNIQGKVRDLMSIYIKKVLHAVKMNYAMPEEMADKNNCMKKLKECYKESFLSSKFEWAEIKEVLYDACESIRLFVINSKSDMDLDYKKYDQDKQGLTAIAIGGLSLSRGLTIEGLCVSYMYRNTRMYDTLMQMGRWFGYRDRYKDLCKIYLSPDSINWYTHIAEASEELRQQIKKMQRDGCTPEQFGLYVRAHPDHLLITALNKMRSGKKLTLKQNYSGRLIEMDTFSSDDKVHSENEKLISEYWKNKFNKNIKSTTKGWISRNIPTNTIWEFLNHFDIHQSFAAKKSPILEYLREIEDEYPTSDVLLISVKKNGEEENEFRLGTQKRTVEKGKPGQDFDFWRVKKFRVASRNDERLGLSEEQQKEAEKIAKERNAEKASDVHFREVRKRPLLMIHILEWKNEDISPSSNRFPAFGVSFPPGNYEIEVEIIANPVWTRQMYGNSSDGPDDSPDLDEDYD